MRKLQHQNSCHVTAIQSSDALESPQLLQVESEDSMMSEAKALQGKILLLEERGKSIQQFYQNKLAQLRAVLSRQGQTRNELQAQLTRLNAEGKKQQRYVIQMKNRSEQEKLNSSYRMKPALPQPSTQKNAVKRCSRGKPSLLFHSKEIAVAPTSKLALKKCRSEQYFQLEYFAGETQVKVQKSTPSQNNPERGRNRPFQ